MIILINFPHLLVVNEKLFISNNVLKIWPFTYTVYVEILTRKTKKIDKYYKIMLITIKWMSKERN